MNTLEIFGLVGYTSLRANTSDCDRTDAENVVKVWCKKPGDSEIRQTYWNDSSSIRSAINLNGKIALAVHGYTMTYYESHGAMREWINVWSDAENITACAIDWGIWSRCAYYKMANEFVYYVSDFVGRFVDELRNEYEVPTENIILSGHSLGAIIVGAAGNQLVPKMKLCYGKHEKFNDTYRE